MNTYQNWLEKLVQSWEKKDYLLLESILDESLEYFEHPLEKPFTKRKEVLKQWKNNLSIQKNINIEYELLSIDNNQCIAS